MSDKIDKTEVIKIINDVFSQLNTPFFDEKYNLEKPDLFDDPARWGMWRQKKFFKEQVDKLIQKLELM